jgi:hypothetical protein
MPYFHVVAEFDDAPEKPVAIFMDLSRTELQAQFIKPYERGSDLASKNSIYPVRRLRKIHVIQTEKPSEQELAEVQRKSREEIDELNRDSPVLFLSVGYGYESQDIVETGADITQVVIKGPPGSKAGGPAVAALLNNGWVVGIGGGMVVAVLVWLFKLN